MGKRTVHFLLSWNKKNINRAIKRASEANTGDFSESTFEAYGLGGASFVITRTTDDGSKVNILNAGRNWKLAIVQEPRLDS